MTHTAPLAPYQRRLSWLLVWALLALVLAPTHYHLHHQNAGSVADGAAHGHLIDRHFALDPAAAEHHQDSSLIDPAADQARKVFDLQPPLLALLLVLLLLPRPALTPGRRPRPDRHRPPRPHWRTSPPPRAPPAA